MSEWQPIETAPKGEEILIGNWYEDDANGCFGESRWMWIAQGCYEDGDWWHCLLDEPFSAIKGLCGANRPTHWIPLPTPPQPKGEQE